MEGNKKNMENKKRIYGIISVLLFIISIVVLAIIDKTSNIRLSLTIQILLIAYFTKIAYGCILSAKNHFIKHRFSYYIIIDLGVAIFFSINVLRQINLLIIDWNLTNINDIYNNTLNSFSYFAYFILPLIIALVIYSIVSNIVLIFKVGFKKQNLMGILFGVLVFLGAVSSQIIFKITDNIELINSQIYIKKFIDISLNVVLCYFYCLTLATLYCNIMAGRHKPQYDKDFVIILGAKVLDDGTLSRALKGRVDKAIEFAKEQKDKAGKSIIFIPSGGKGKDEIISEAEAMRDYLIENGVNPEDIVIENQSTNTLQNMRFSKQKIDKINKDGKILFSTTNYHIFRSGVIASNEGIECEGIGSKTKWYFYTNAMIREFIANIFYKKKVHFLLVISINIVILILVLIGYHYNLI